MIPKSGFLKLRAKKLHMRKVARSEEKKVGLPVVVVRVRQFWDVSDAGFVGETGTTGLAT